MGGISESFFLIVFYTYFIQSGIMYMIYRVQLIYMYLMKRLPCADFNKDRER